MRVSFILAVVSFILSVIAHFSTYLDIDPIDVFPPVFILHIGIFAIWGIAALEEKLTRIDIIEKKYSQSSQSQEQKYTPGWMAALAGVCFVYAFINFALFIYLMREGNPLGHDGKYYLKESRREITEEEFHKYQAYEVRGFSGHWMVFYSTFMFMFYGRMGARKAVYTQAVEPLMKLLTDPNALVHEREQAAIALKKVGDSRAIYALLNVLEDENRTLQKQVVITLNTLCRIIQAISFGRHLQDLDPRYTLWNPEVSSLTASMSNLKIIVIDTNTYDFYQIERFVTYAVNYIGSRYLHHNVDVHLYGDPEKLSPNLRNTLTNLCKRVHVHEVSV